MDGPTASECWSVRRHFHDEVCLRHAVEGKATGEGMLNRLRRTLRVLLQIRRPLLLGTAALVLLAAAPLAFSQSCALCYTQAASAGARMIEALRSGILILIIPPTFMSVAMIFIVYRKRNQFRPTADSHDSDHNW
jgi:hypothetical protein